VNKLYENFFKDIVLKVESVNVDIENIDIEEQSVPLLIAAGSVTDIRASYDFEGVVTFSAEHEGKLELDFFVRFYGSAQVCTGVDDVSIDISLDEPVNEDFTFIDDDGEEGDLTAEVLFELVEETEDYESEIHCALPGLNELLGKD